MAFGNSSYVTIGPGKFLQIPEATSVAIGEVVWHYTNSSALISILTSHRVWASSAYMMNDSAEIHHGLSVVEDAWSRKRDQGDLSDIHRNFIDRAVAECRELITGNGVYVLCASSEGDSLSQWRGYASGVGVAIGLRAGAGLNVYAPEALGKYYNRFANRGLGWVRVQYTKEEQEGLAEATLQFLV